MCKPKQDESFQRILVKIQKCRQLPTYRKPDDSSHIQTHRLLLSILIHQTLATPGDPSLSCLLTSLPCFLCYILSLIIFKIIPHPMTLLIAFPLQVIISYLILYRLLLLPHCHITYLLPSSHIPSPRIHPTHCLNPLS
jgi:hypothetical protein